MTELMLSSRHTDKRPLTREVKMPKIFKRGKTYYVRGVFQGIHIYRSLGVEDEAAAYIETGRLLEYLRGGGDLNAKTMTIADACDVFVKNGPGMLRASSWKQMVMRIRVLVSMLGETRVDDLVADRRAKILLAFIEKSREAGRKDPSIRNNLILLSSAIKAVRATYKLPSNRVLGLAQQQAKLNYLTEDEFLGLLPLVEERYRAFVAIARYTGLRISDVYGLRWPMIDRVGMVIDAKTLKTGKQVRSPIPKQLVPVLNDLWASRVLGDDRLFREAHWVGFSGRVRIAFKAACKKIGRQDMRLHDLRHSFCTSLAKAGVQIGTIADMAGHSTTRTTEKYVHFDDTDRKLSSEKAFGGGKK